MSEQPMEWEDVQREWIATSEASLIDFLNENFFKCMDCRGYFRWEKGRGAICMNCLNKCDGSRVRLCKNVGVAPHTCPFEEEIHDNKEILCNCCPECETECRWNI